MDDTLKVGRMTLTRHGDEWRGEHPFGGMVVFYQFSSDGAKKWTWRYNDAHGATFDNIEDCVEHWREIVGLPI